MTEELKPCPFCGSPARLNRSTGESLWSHDQVEWTQVQCTNEDCGVATENHCEGWEPTPIESWNSRALSASQPAQAGEVDERVAFEAWKRTMLSGFDAWEAWQARASLPTQPAQAERIAELGADYQRLMDKHNALHVNALKDRTERDTLRAEVSANRERDALKIAGLHIHAELRSIVNAGGSDEVIGREFRKRALPNIEDEVVKLRDEVERLREADGWREAVGNELTILHASTPSDPREAVKKLVTLECQIALDPVVSEQAYALVQRGRDDVKHSPIGLADALADWGFSVHDDDEGRTWLTIRNPDDDIARVSVPTVWPLNGNQTIGAVVLHQLNSALAKARSQRSQA